jgi:peptidoglycan/xylan/chitin deacetylase (PgdA/CDA1 family)
MRKLFLLALLLLFFSSEIWANAHVFVYHRFGDTTHASTNTTLKQLRSQFEYFKNNNYKVISMSQLQDALYHDKKIDPKWILLTIDDSYKSFYENGLALFKEYGYPFTLFVYVEATDKNYGDFMSWDQIRDTQKYGEIALHSYAHKHMVSLSLEDVQKDTSLAYQRFSKEMGFKPLYYVYPYGEYTPEIQKIIKNFNFKIICNQNSGAIDKDSNPFDLDRIALTGSSVLKYKLRIKTLPTHWITPTVYPPNGKLQRVHATIPPIIKKAQFYISGSQWQNVKVNKGEVIVDINTSLTKKRTRLFLKYGNQQSARILVRP